MTEDKKPSFLDEEKTYKRRFVISLLVSFAFSFTFIFYAAFETTATNQNTIIFTPGEVALVMGIVALAVTLILAVCLAFIRGKAFCIVMSILTGIVIAGYVQAAFFNNGIVGKLDGSIIDLSGKSLQVILNLVVWVALILALIIILGLNRKVWKAIVVFTMALIIIMQGAGLVGVFVSLSTGENVAGIDTSAKKEENDKLEFTNKDINTFSKYENVLVFLLDRLDYDYIEKVLADDPNFFDKLDGFTSYTNMLAQYARTRPGANFLLTNYENKAYYIPSHDYFTQSWQQDRGSILHKFKEGGFKTDLYDGDGVSNMLGEGELYTDYVDNLGTIVGKNYPSFVLQWLRYSLFRYAPTQFKPDLVLTTEEINSSMNTTTTYTEDDAELNAALQTPHYNNNKYFKFYHMRGPHSPFSLNEDGTRNLGETDLLSQTKGVFNILYSLFDKMKENGSYHRSTIIITSDHGSAISDHKPVQKATTIGTFVKYVGDRGDLKYSNAEVSQLNIPATILKGANLDYTGYEKPLDEVSEDEHITRHMYKSVEDENNNNHETYVVSYDVKGDAKDFSNWVITHEDKIENYFY